MIRVIFNEEEWTEYKKFFPVGQGSHTPAHPPVYPVLVESACDRNFEYTRHSFVEVDALKRMLGIK